MSIINFKLFVCLFALRPKSTAMVMAGRSDSPNHTFSLADLNNQLCPGHTFTDHLAGSTKD